MESCEDKLVIKCIKGHKSCCVIGNSKIGGWSTELRLVCFGDQTAFVVPNVY